MEPEETLLKGSNNHDHVIKKTPPDQHEDGVPLLEAKNRVNDDSSSSSSSSSSSDSTSSFQLDHQIMSHPSEKPQLTDDNLSSSSDTKPTKMPLNEPSSENAPETVTEAQYSDTMKSPPIIQTMGPLSEPTGYDPNRIPASIFSTKPTTPNEWSVASNESLFSIHMGNNSFSRDYAILFGKSGELPRTEDWPSGQPNPFGKSGELPRLDDWNNNNNNIINNNDQVVMINNSLPPVMEVPSHEETNSVQSGELSRSHNDDKSPTVENHQKEKEMEKPAVLAAVSTEVAVAKKPTIAESANSSSNNLPPYSSPPRFSNGSGHSGSSFAFPVLVSESGKTAGSLKVVPEKEEVLVTEGKGEESKENIPGNAEPQTKSWFSCFACWPRCC